MMRIFQTLHYLLITFFCLFQDIHTISESNKSRYVPLVPPRSDYLRKQSASSLLSKVRQLQQGSRRKNSDILVGRRQLEELPRYLPQKIKGKYGRGEPSCAELRSMWWQLKRLTRHSEITNEIPQVMPQTKMDRPEPTTWSPSTMSYVSTTSGQPLKYRYRNNPMKNKYRYFQGRRKQKTAKNLGFGKFFRNGSSRKQWNPVRHHSTGSSATKMRERQESLNADTPRYYGTFEDVPMPEESLGAYGTMVYSPFEKLRNAYRNRKLGARRRFRYRYPSFEGRRRYNYGRPPSFPSSKYRNYDGTSTFSRRLSRQKYRYVPEVQNGPEDDDRVIESLGFGDFAENEQVCPNGNCNDDSDTDGLRIDEFGIWHGNPVDMSSSRNKRPLVADLISSPEVDVSST